MDKEARRRFLQGRPKLPNRYDSVYTKEELSLREHQVLGSHLPKTPETLQEYAARAKRFCGAAVGADYSDDEREFMLAMESYKRDNKRPYPTCCEVLAVLKSLGYRKEGYKMEETK